MNTEVKSYLRWLGIREKQHHKVTIVQRHRCSLMVENGDSEILLEDDKRGMNREEFDGFVNLVICSGQTFLRLYRSARFKNRIDQARIRNTIYGENPKTIQKIFNHVGLTQYYYLSRASVDFEQKVESFTKIMRFCLEKLGQLFERSDNSLQFHIGNETLTQEDPKPLYLA